MRCLWLTRIDPYPADSGELIYSAELIRAFAAAGADVTVLCLAREGRDSTPSYRQDGVVWHTIPENTRPSWMSVRSALPNLAYRCALPRFRRDLRGALERESWDCIVLDSLAAGWALPEIQSAAARGRSSRPRIVYVSHNHEASTRASVAREIGGSMLGVAARRIDATKAAALERQLVRQSDLVTAISPRDVDLYAKDRDGRALIELTPGYCGRRRETREITRDTPRRVVMVGSYEWGAKKANLREFVNAAITPLDVADIELRVVGKGGDAIDDLLIDSNRVKFTGRVDDVYEHLDGSRIAVIPERLGGGFKLKALEYVFNRMPIVALDNAFPGVPLVDNESVLTYPDFSRLAGGLIRAIDDIPLLNGLQQAAYRNCADRFDWGSRGTRLLDAVGAL